MNNQAKIIIGALAALAAILAIGLAMSLASDDDMGMGGSMSMSMSMSDGNHSMAIMQAMGNMNSDAMLEHMRQVLGEDGYQRMLAHMQDHRNGASMPSGASIDDMMHRMMDGMMQQMPSDQGGNMP